MNEVRRAHFSQSGKLISQFKGREIKTTGDSFLVAFKCVDAALDYARALQAKTGHPQVQIRPGSHIGPMHVEEGDVFGDTVNYAARVIGGIKGAEIWLSERAQSAGMGTARGRSHEGFLRRVQALVDERNAWQVREEVP